MMTPVTVTTEWHERFVQMLPSIQRYASMAFRHMKTEAREEAISDVIANSLVAFVRLVELNKVAIAYATVLARYAVAHYRDGRRVGTCTNSKHSVHPLTSPLMSCV